jgi:predicted nuclease with TOPRIM domain
MSEQKTKKSYYRSRKSKSKNVVSEGTELLNMAPTEQIQEVEFETETSPEVQETSSKLESDLAEVEQTITNLKESFSRDLADLGSKLEAVNKENTDLVLKNTNLNKTLVYKDKLIDSLKKENLLLEEKLHTLENRNWFQRLFS